MNISMIVMSISHVMGIDKIPYNNECSVLDPAAVRIDSAFVHTGDPMNTIPAFTTAAPPAFCLSLLMQLTQRKWSAMD